MKLTSKVLGIAVAAVLGTVSPTVAAEWKPDGPIKLQIAFAAGGSTDTLGRVLAKVMESQTGWNVVAENKPGGGGVAMFTGISKMKPMGTTIGLGVNMPILVNLHRRGDKLAFNIDSFDYLGTISATQIALIADAKAPFDDLEGMMAHAKKNGPITVAFDAPPQKLLMAAATRKSGAKFNMVSTKGGSEILKLILGGQAMAGFGAGEHFQYLESGKMKVIAAGTKERLNYNDKVKTFAESGVNVYVDPYFYLATTKGTPPDALKALTAAIDNALKSDEMVKIVKNAISNTPLNLGPAGTKQMFLDGMDNVKILFAK